MWYITLNTKTARLIAIVAGILLLAGLIYAYSGDWRGFNNTYLGSADVKESILTPNDFKAAFASSKSAEVMRCLLFFIATSFSLFESLERAVPGLSGHISRASSA